VSSALAWGAALTWAVAGYGATPAALWLRLRAGRRDAGAAALVAFLGVEIVGLGALEGGVPRSLLEGREGVGTPVWLGLAVGAAGLAALAVASRPGEAADRVAALAFGLFGLGHLLRALALAIGAPG
jgi:hypothetical protein